MPHPNPTSATTGSAASAVADDEQAFLFTCTGCGNAIHEDPDGWCALPGWEAPQHAPGCLTHVAAGLRSMQAHYLAAARNADGVFSALNYRKDAERVQGIADLVDTLTVQQASAAPASADVSLTPVRSALSDFRDALADGLAAATDGYSKASYGSDLSHVQALLALVPTSTSPAPAAHR